MGGWIDNSVLNSRNSPAIGSGLLADIPVTAPLGFLYVATDAQAWYRWDGTGWVLIGGPGTGTITGSGTPGKLAKFTGATVLGDSIVTESANLLTINGAIDTGPYTTTTTNITINEAGIGNGSIIYLKGGAIYYNFIIAKQYTPGLGNNAVEITPSTTPGGSTFTSPVFVVDYLGNSITTTITANNHIVPGGTSAQFLKADGSIDSSVYIQTSAIGVTVQPYNANTTILGNTTTGTGSIVLNNQPALILPSFTAIQVTGGIASLPTGTGTLLYASTLTGYVPYTGATASVNLGAFNLAATRLNVNGAIDNITYALNVSGAVAANSYNIGSSAITTTATGPTGFVNSFVNYSGSGFSNLFGVDGTFDTKYFGIKTDGTFVHKGGSANFLGDLIVDNGTIISGIVNQPIELRANGIGAINLNFNQGGNLVYYGGTSVPKLLVSTTGALSVAAIANSDWGIAISNDGTTGANGLYVNIGSSATGIPFRVDKGGSALFLVSNAGIVSANSRLNVNGATDSASYQLNVAGSMLAEKLFLNTSSNYLGGINSTNANGGYYTFETSSTVIADIGTANNIFGSGGADVFGINARGARSLLFGTNNTKQVEINSSGNVLINTTTNTYKLNVAGGIYDSDTQATLNQSKFGVFGGMTFTATGTETATYINAGIAGGYVMAVAGTFTPVATAKQGAIVGSYYITAASTVAGIQNAIYANCELASSGTITTLATYRVGTPQQFSGGSAFTGTITNMVGLYIDDISGSSLAARFTNKYGIYQEGTSDKNFLGGELILGSGQVVSASTTNTNTNKIKLIVNGTTYYLLASTSAT